MANEVRIGLGVTGADKAAYDLKKVGNAADGTGDDLRGMAADAKVLDEAIDDLNAQLVKTRMELAKDPGDKALWKQLRGQEREVSKLTKLRKMVFGSDTDTKNVGKDAGKLIGSGIGEALGALPSQLKGAGIAIGVGLAAAAAPFIGSAVGAAVIGGVGLGGIAGGIAAAAQDPRVKAAGEHLGDSLKGSFTGIGEPFIDPLIDQMGRLEGIGSAFFAKLGDDIAPLADHLDHLTDGVAGFARNLDFSKAAKAAGPLLDIIGDELPEVGEALSDMFESISEESGGLAIGLTQVFDVIETGIRLTGSFIGTLAALNEDVTDAASNLGHMADEFRDSPFMWLAPYFTPLSLAISDVGDKADEYTHRAIRAKDESIGLAMALKEAADDAVDFSDAIDKLFGKNMDVAEATSRYKNGVRDLREELTEGKRTLNENTEEGLKNADAIREQINNIEELRKSEFAQTGDIKATTAAYEARIEKIRAEAIALGFDKAAVDAIVNAWKNIPKQVDTQYRVDVKFSNQEFRGKLLTGEIHSLEHRASGGPVMAGKSYVVNENGVEILTAGQNGYVMNASQSKAMMSGSSGGSAMAGTQEIRIMLDIRVDDEEQARRIRKQVEALGGGNVQVAYGSS